MPFVQFVHIVRAVEGAEMRRCLMQLTHSRFVSNEKCFEYLFTWHDTTRHDDTLTHTYEHESLAKTLAAPQIERIETIFVISQMSSCRLCLFFSRFKFHCIQLYSIVCVFLIGFSAVIPGFPRYSVLGDRVQGVYNIKVSNASLEDDAEFQCQVGPARLHSAIRANAKLTVICK